jgi:hypothetical protein
LTTLAISQSAQAAVLPSVAGPGADLISLLPRVRDLIGFSSL